MTTAPSIEEIMEGWTGNVPVTREQLERMELAVGRIRQQAEANRELPSGAAVLADALLLERLFDELLGTGHET